MKIIRKKRAENRNSEILETFSKTRALPVGIQYEKNEDDKEDINMYVGLL